MLKFFFNLLILLITLYFTPISLADTEWQTLSNGLDYTNVTVNSAGGKIHAFRVNLNDYKISLVRAKDYGSSSDNIINLALDAKGLIAINGGFFDPFHNELGLRIQDGQLLNPLRPISWWGVFYILNSTHPYISSQQTFSLNPSINFAVQSGPRLVVDGSIPPLKDSYASRSALGIDKENRVIIAITENIAMTPNAFAAILQAPAEKDGLACYNALNLDGGSSSQLYAHINQFNLMIPSFSNIADAIVVSLKKK
ncbi:MAG: phosphodiester glycosidase family protein [Legionellales bacterium]|nr:phosphodiester glycosidase family protein [Legionellales bacterium]